jgi:hypothetical protein
MHRQRYVKEAPMKVRGFAYVRENSTVEECGEWIDVDSIRILPSSCTEYKDSINEKFPVLAKACPFLRMVRVEVTDIDEPTESLFNAFDKLEQTYFAAAEKAQIDEETMEIVSDLIDKLEDAFRKYLPKQF